MDDAAAEIFIREVSNPSRYADAFGAKAGCAGGMVAGPVGMVSGCIGGAAMDGANGFIGGVAVELLGSCFRH